MSAAVDLSITPYEGAAMATRLSPEIMEEAVQALLPEQVPVYLRRLDEASGLINALRKLLIGRMLVEKRLDERVEIDGTMYVFERVSSADWDDLPGLFRTLEDLGLPRAQLDASISGVRVTDLREAASRLTFDTSVATAMEQIEDHRVWKKSAPRLVAEDDPYRRKR